MELKTRRTYEVENTANPNTQNSSHRGFHLILENMAPFVGLALFVLIVQYVIETINTE